MALNYDKLMALKRTGDRFSYTDRETMLYAIGIGMSRDPYDENELAYTFERAKLKTVASMATVLQRVPLLKDCGFDYSKVVHGEQRLTLHRPLEPEGEIVVDSRVLSAFDKGPGKGAVINSEMAVRSAKDNAPLYTLVSTTFARGDGGFGGPNGAGLEPHRIPERKPDLTGRRRDAHRPGAALPPQRRSQPAACRPRARQARRLPGADPAWPVHLRHGLPHDPQGGRQVRPHAHPLLRRALLRPRLSRRDHSHGHVGRQERRVVPLPAEGARGDRDQQRQVHAGCVSPRG